MYGSPIMLPAFPSPREFWCDDPVELATSWASDVAHDHVGANVRHIVFARPHQKWLRRIARLGDDKAGLLRTLFGGERGRVVSTAIQEAVVDVAGDIRPPLLTWMNRPRRSGGVRLCGRPAFAESGCGPRDLCGASFAASVEKALDGDVGPALRGLRLIARHAGWLVPNERVCWLSRQPDVSSTDPLGRLHCGSGPALGYRDGWSVYAWKGTPMPAWVIMQPKQITLQWIDAQIDPRIRHAMIDIFTPARFIASGGAERAGMDETGTLWKRKWSHRGVVIDSWAAFEPAHEKGTFRCVPAELSTPREALARIVTSAPRRRQLLRGPRGDADGCCIATHELVARAMTVTKTLSVSALVVSKAITERPQHR